MKNGRQLTAAMGLLDWTIDRLVLESGVNKMTISKIRNAATVEDMETFNGRTIYNIVSAINRAGVKFTETGVEEEKSHFVLEGKDRYDRLFDDIEAFSDATKYELLIDGGVEHKTPDYLLNRVEGMRQLGLTMRTLAKEGDDQLRWPLSEYRWIPSKYFMNQVIFIYPNTVAIDNPSDKAIYIHRDKNLHLSQKKKFEMQWDLFKEPDDGKK